MSTPDANGGGSDDAGSGAGDPTPAEGRPAGTIADVTDVLARGPLQIQVQRAEQVETVEVFGFSRPPEAGLAAFEVTIAFKNAAAAYVSFVTDSFGMLADDAVVADASSFAALTSRSFGGVALAPGELRVYDLVYEAPDGSAFAVIDVAGTNGSQLPVAFGVGGGGFALRDDAGRTYTNAGGVRGGRVDGREIIRLSNGTPPGESAAGLQVALVPADATPLYVSYTVPPALWLRSDDVAEHTFFWQVR